MIAEQQWRGSLIKTGLLAEHHLPPAGTGCKSSIIFCLFAPVSLSPRISAEHPLMSHWRTSSQSTSSFPCRLMSMGPGGPPSLCVFFFVSEVCCYGSSVIRSGVCLRSPYQDTDFQCSVQQCKNELSTSSTSQCCPVFKGIGSILKSILLKYSKQTVSSFLIVSLPILAHCLKTWGYYHLFHMMPTMISTLIHTETNAQNKQTSLTQTQRHNVTHLSK